MPHEIQIWTATFLSDVVMCNLLKWCGKTQGRRKFKISRPRTPRKGRLKLSEFAFFQSLSRLLQLIYFVKCKRTLFEPKFSRRLFTSSIKREIGHFHVVAVQWRQRNVQKRSAELLFWLFNLLLVLKFSLSPPSWPLKVFLKSIKILIRVSDKLEICPLENSEKYEPW